MYGVGLFDTASATATSFCVKKSHVQPAAWSIGTFPNQGWTCEPKVSLEPQRIRDRSRFGARWPASEGVHQLHFAYLRGGVPLVRGGLTMRKSPVSASALLKDEPASAVPIGRVLGRFRAASLGLNCFEGTWGGQARVGEGAGQRACPHRVDLGADVRDGGSLIISVEYVSDR